jgi:cell division protein ZapE
MSDTPQNPAAAQSPQDAYRRDLAQGLITSDASQQHAVAALQLIFEQLSEKWSRPQSWWTRVSQRLGFTTPQPVRGLYLWGGVGRGKTYLMDLFFHALPGNRKLRMHFHRFMLMVHKRLADAKGQSDPLKHVAGDIAKDVDIICFDEFFVSDIGDAMILANLMDALFSSGVALVATSNIEPEHLYEHGLQRRKFLPAIALIRRYCTVLNVDGGIDYRLRSLDKAPVFHFPLNAASAQALQDLFNELTRGLRVETNKILDIQERKVAALAWSEGLVWFDFDVLCGGPRSAADYIEIARQYHTVLISGIPVLRERDDDKARRFITLVDEFYDHGVKLVLSAADNLEHLYQGADLQFAFTRTRSRLLEMQTREYLGSAHRPD